MRAQLVIAACTLGVVACGLSLTGVAGDSADAGAERSSNLAPTVPNGDDAGTESDALLMPESQPDVAEAIPPDPTKVVYSYAAGKDSKVYRLDLTAGTFQALLSTGCPVAEEMAVFSTGEMFVTSTNGRVIYTFNPATGCTQLRAALAAEYPYSLGTAPKGTVSLTEETLVGYVNADYVRINPVNGTITTITTNALGSMRPSGDLTAIGTKGYLAAQNGTGGGATACSSSGNGDCIVQINLATGRPMALVKKMDRPVYGIAHSGGKLLLYAADRNVYAVDPVTVTIGVALVTTPTGADFTGAAAAPFPPP